MRCGTVSPRVVCIRLDRLCSSWSTAQIRRIRWRTGSGDGTRKLHHDGHKVTARRSNSVRARRTSALIRLLFVLLAPPVFHADEKGEDGGETDGGENGDGFEHVRS